MEYDYSKLRGRIVERFGSCAKFEKAARWYANKVNRILNNKVKMFTEDLEIFCDMLEIPPEEIRTYFFTKKV